MAVIGTIGELDRAARRDLLDLASAFSRLRATNFRYPPTLLDRLLGEDRARRGEPQRIAHDLISTGTFRPALPGALAVPAADADDAEARRYLAFFAASILYPNTSSRG